MADSEKDVSNAQVRFTGSCACGRITYECVEQPSRSATSACHCVTCRKLSGGPYQAFTDVSSRAMTFFDNKDGKKRYEGLPKDGTGGIAYINFSKGSQRAFCASCYSPLATQYRHMPNAIGLILGSVDEGSIADAATKEGLKLSSHIFISQKAGWFDMENDGLPAHERFDSEELEKKILG